MTPPWKNPGVGKLFAVILDDLGEAGFHLAKPEAEESCSGHAQDALLDRLPEVWVGCLVRPYLSFHRFPASVRANTALALTMRLSPTCR